MIVAADSCAVGEQNVMHLSPQAPDAVGVDSCPETPMAEVGSSQHKGRRTAWSGDADLVVLDLDLDAPPHNDQNLPSPDDDQGIFQDFKHGGV